MATPQERERIAHVFRRCGFGPSPGAVEAWEDRGAEELIEYLLAIEAEHWRTEDELLAGFENYIDQGDDWLLAGVMIRQMMTGFMHAENPLHERITWFWHTHLTSSLDRCTPLMMWRQHHLVRQHALGHFPTLLRQITTDAAMLYYLDGADSYGSDPNENHARELLELFALGRNAGYGEQDVRAAARIMAGWWVEWDTGEVNFDEDRAYSRPVTFLGERRRWTLDSFIEHICAQPSCGRHIASRLYSHLVGSDPSEGRLDELARVFGDAGLQVRPLVAAIVRGSDFIEAVRSRARQPLEWLLGARLALGFDTPFDEDEFWRTEVLGQMPFEPPNVAGWPLDDRWASASQIITRTAALLDWQIPESVWDQIEPTTAAVLARCGIYDPSDTTVAALKSVETQVSEYDGLLEVLFAAALISPEFSLL